MLFLFAECVDKVYHISMTAEEISQKIFDIALPYAKEMSAPVSYINVEAGCNVPVSDDELWNAFNKLKWDTVLSSAELMIIRKPYASGTQKSLRVVSITPFEDDEGVSGPQPVRNGTI